MIGHDLAGRYEIISRIGGGGMALVYKAHDVLLNRKVAVKVLRQQFVHDEEFIRRFRREGQSAASLSHPNVVSIYDVGQEDDIHYIVMEYVEGHNLNEIIIERAPLQIEEAVHIAQQICEALDHAHTNHIIHRDIKPHNILIGNNGRVKVTDFGIARAVTSTTITHTGSVVGSVHYFSPEHAKGVNTGEKSDLYSLGIVLYQMLTGKLPFFGESPISIALKHLQDEFEEPRVVNSHIPQSVENIILKSMRKNPNERYDSAKAMMEDLETCLQPRRLYEPKIMFNEVDNMQETKIMPAIRSSQIIDTHTVRAQPPTSNTTRYEDTSSMNTAQLEEEDSTKKENSWKKPLIIAGITLIFLALLIWGFFKLLDSFRTDDVDIPYVVGMTLDKARQEIAEKGLKIQEPVKYESSKIVPKDQVMEQSKMNMKVKEGHFIELTVSSGPEMKVLPNYVGDMKIATINALVELGIKESQLTFNEVNDDSPVGTILEQTPNSGEEINPDTVQITFTVSKGPETVMMEDLTDMRLKDAKVLISSLGLVLNENDIKYEASYLYEKDHVISQGETLPQSQIVKGSKVSITVSTGYPADAKSYQFNVRISPANSGSASEIKIYYSDARGENMEIEPRMITSTVDIPVTIVIDPDTVASVSVYRDGTFMDIKKIKYSDVTSGNTTGLVIPGNDIPPTEPPFMTDNHSGEEIYNSEANENNEQNDELTETTGEN